MKTYIFSLAFLFVLLQSCSTKNHLKTSKSSLLETNNESIVKFGYEESYKTLGHNFEPWETTNYSGKGAFWVDKNTFLKQDTIINSRGRKYTSKTNYDNSILLFLDYGDEELLPLTEDLYFEKIINTSRYSPILVLEYFVKNEADTKIEISSTNVIYSLKIGNYSVKLFINKATNLVDKITYLSYDELYGDVRTSFIYSTYITKDNLTYPNAIQIEKINGKVIEEVKILAAEITSKDYKLLEKPTDYKLIEPNAESKPEIKVTKYNNYIHFIDLSHTDDRVLVVEIEDYVLVAEAPINSKNGELIIAEVKKIAPNKPIKYFIFGHHHPHYLGGLRAFVNQEATILCTDISKNYVEYIANAPHNLKRDNLQLNPKKAKTQVIKDSLILGKNKEMKIYFMGEKSAHTKDYLIYYFPKDKMLFQDDLCSIPSEGAITKAGSRQIGLYNFIKELNLDVATIIQSWPVTNNKVKTIIPFEDLEKSMEIAN
jgi:glyoxylase-like metal-dependent hydrolase (beta-lactamase superfamily II)